tara:strand:- start:2369 stop:2683 length:315 start_codon:yes stop_codon:yes gene_type:complete
MNIISRALKPTLIAVSLLTICINLAYYPINKYYQYHLDDLQTINFTLQVIYYLLAIYIIYLLFKTAKRLIIKIVISIFLTLIIPQVSMIIFLIVDKDINASLKK